MLDDLVAWLRLQWAEDYDAARLALGVNAMADFINGRPPRWFRPTGTSEIRSTRGDILIVKHTWSRESDHIIRHDPTRVLQRIDADRRLLDWLVDLNRKVLDADMWNVDVDDAIQLLALPYADRPGYREEWRP